MNILYEVLKGLRISVSIPAAILVHIGYHIAGKPTQWGLVILLFFITGLVMLQNDYIDRHHDIKKGKLFATEHTTLLVILLFAGWTSVVGATFLFFYQTRLWLLLMVGSGFCYSFCRKLFPLPLLIVAILSASPVLLPSLPQFTYPHAPLFLAILFAIAGREILKDVEDRHVDRGYKRTLITSGVTSPLGACSIAAALITLGGVLSFFVRPFIGTLFYVYVGSLLFLMLSIFYILYKFDVKKGKKAFDLGMMTMLAALAF